MALWTLGIACDHISIHILNRSLECIFFICVILLKAEAFWSIRIWTQGFIRLQCYFSWSVPLFASLHLHPDTVPPFKSKLKTPLFVRAHNYGSSSELLSVLLIGLTSLCSLCTLHLCLYSAAYLKLGWTEVINHRWHLCAVNSSIFVSCLF